MERIDELWLFEPRLINDREMGLLVFALFPRHGAHTGDREIFTLEYQAAFVKGTPAITRTLTEQGRAPADRIHRIIDGVLLRAGEEGDPHVYRLEGNRARWEELLTELGAARLDQPNGE